MSSVVTSKWLESAYLHLCIFRINKFSLLIYLSSAISLFLNSLPPGGLMHCLLPVTCPCLSHGGRVQKAWFWEAGWLESPFTSPMLFNLKFPWLPYSDFPPLARFVILPFILNLKRGLLYCLKKLPKIDNISIQCSIILAGKKNMKDWTFADAD